MISRVSKCESSGVETYLSKGQRSCWKPLSRTSIRAVLPGLTALPVERGTGNSRPSSKDEPTQGLRVMGILNVSRGERDFSVEGAGQDEIVEQALEIIWSHRHDSPLNVNYVARQLPVTRRTLDRRFADRLGRSVLDEINRCRMSRARRLLSETDLLIKTVSYLAGFPSRERMRLSFLRETGLTPLEYRERAQTPNGIPAAGISSLEEEKSGIALRQVS